MELIPRIQVVSILGATLFLYAILELIRRGKLKEQYSLLWLLTGFVIFCFAVKRNLIDQFGDMVGIHYSPAALLLVMTGFFALILLHFSSIVSVMSERNHKLAQRIALLEYEFGEIRAPEAHCREAASSEEDRFPEPLRASGMV